MVELGPPPAADWSSGDPAVCLKRSTKSEAIIREDYLKHD
jgi:hypothetical protein